MIYSISGDCHFDAGLCADWSNAHAGDDFDWTVQSGRTPSALTGPDNDNSGNGKCYCTIGKTIRRLEYRIIVSRSANNNRTHNSIEEIMERREAIDWDILGQSPSLRARVWGGGGGGRLV